MSPLPLASQVAASRSVLAERFTQLVGEAPLQYLTRWRLLLARQQLRSGRESIASIGEEAGYHSPEAFQRAFKRLYGETPAACRKMQQAV